ncbi:SRPBCC family protein [Marinicella sp. S1101]|uniref:SRPBCC family protein n=1 Tax=Marinicella marina TaxID=2996016 RepID=UPI002260F8A5|nr:SRPBCC family protein [Marinicella marina]MCX7554346.1 SRPBCC family protein [Marinicella marina]MDJ1138663.1 SRPBCC family protein [Marinicella marina]
MRVFKYLFFALLFLVVAFYAYGFFFLEDEVQVSRSVTIDRPAKKVFKAVNSMHHFNKWSPWAKLDPEAKYDYEGPEFGVGSYMSWTGNEEVGSGRQTIIESVPNERVKTKLYFDGQGDEPSYATYLIKDLGNQSEVTWVFDADFNGDILGRYFGMMMDDMLGPEYQKGLNNLKQLVESQPVYDFSGFSTENVQPQSILYVSTSANTNQDVAPIIQAAYDEITTFMFANNIEFAGQPIAITRSWENDVWEFDAAIPVNISSIEGDTGDVMLGQTYAGTAVKYVQMGSYDQGEASYALMDAYLVENELQINGDLWEVYVNDPQNVAEADIITHFYQPIK